LPSLCPLIHWS
jgi:hypothetical protein